MYRMLRVPHGTLHPFCTLLVRVLDALRGPALGGEERVREELHLVHARALGVLALRLRHLRPERSRRQANCRSTYCLRRHGACRNDAQFYTARHLERQKGTLTRDAKSADCRGSARRRTTRRIVRARASAGRYRGPRTPLRRIVCAASTISGPSPRRCTSALSSTGPRPRSGMDLRKRAAALNWGFGFVQCLSYASFRVSFARLFV